MPNNDDADRKQSDLKELEHRISYENELDDNYDEDANDAEVEGEYFDQGDPVTDQEVSCLCIVLKYRC